MLTVFDYLNVMRVEQFNKESIVIAKSIDNNRVLFEGQVEAVKAWEMHFVFRNCSVTFSDAELPILPKYMALAAL